MKPISLFGKKEKSLIITNGILITPEEETTRIIINV